MLGAALAAVLMRQTRNSMIEVMSADYIRTAYSKGLAGRVVVFRHAIRNSLIPVITILGLQMGALISGAVVTEQAFRWRNHCRAADVSAATCTAATFSLPPGTDNGRSQSGRFNYKRLGATQSVQVALMRRNNDPVFAGFVATNEPGGNGMSVFALDVATGRKLWEFDNPYDKTTDAASGDHSKMADGLDNTPPQGTTLFSKTGTSLIDTVYVGDLEGSLWEIDAADGLNLTSYASRFGGSTSCTLNGPA